MIIKKERVGNLSKYFSIDLLHIIILYSSYFIFWQVEFLSSNKLYFLKKFSFIYSIYNLFPIIGFILILNLILARISNLSGHIQFCQFLFPSIIY